ncbi:hypothetical protein BDW02DRAFT_474557, partial [Decorospora gaudefroyi]
YRCLICCDKYPFTEGLSACGTHFLCNACIIDSFHASLPPTGLFPAKCCAPLPRRPIQHLLSPTTIEAYKAKAKEHYVPSALRVYCVNEDCRAFVPEDRFDNEHAWYSVARCICGTDTCVGCKREWEGDTHGCPETDEVGFKPEWMPEYSDSCRIKRCPNCRVGIELREACNHMMCCYCRYEFCFVRLVDWGTGFHEDEGCPSYGDPIAGYDEEGFEIGERGLHRDSGL